MHIALARNSTYDSVTCIMMMKDFCSESYEVGPNDIALSRWPWDKKFKIINSGLVDFQINFHYIFLKVQNILLVSGKHMFLCVI